MPVWLRKYNLMKINEVIKAQNDTQNVKNPNEDFKNIPKMPQKTDTVTKTPLKSTQDIKNIAIKNSKIPIKNSSKSK